MKNVAHIRYDNRPGKSPAEFYEIANVSHTLNSELINTRVMFMLEINNELVGKITGAAKEDLGDEITNR